MTECPKCGGELWDNREMKRSGKMKPNGPDFACKDKEGCGWLQWPPKGKPIVKTAGGPGMPAMDRNPKHTWATLGDTYQRSLIEARKRVVGLGAALKLEVRLEDVLTAAHCIFIQACKEGVKLPQPEPAPDEEEVEV